MNVYVWESASARLIPVVLTDVGGEGQGLSSETPIFRRERSTLVRAVLLQFEIFAWWTITASLNSTDQEISGNGYASRTPMGA